MGFDLGALLRNAAGPAADVLAAHKQRDASLAEKQRQIGLQQVAQQRQARLDEQQSMLQQATMGHLNAQADALRTPKPVVPHNMDPLSPEGITASAARAKAEAEAVAPYKKDPNVTEARSPILGSPEWLDAQDKLQKIKNKNRPPSQTGVGALSPRVQSLQQHFNNDQTFKDAQQVATSYQKIKGAATGEHTATSDMSLVYGLMKMQDPGSTVREGEYATAENAKGVPDQIRNLYNKAKDGAILSERQRQQFHQTASSIASAQRSVFKGTLKRYSDMASRQKVDPNDVVFDPYDGLFEDAPTVAASTTGGRGGGNPDNKPGPVSLQGGATREQQLWDAAVAKHGKNKVLQTYGPRP